MRQRVEMDLLDMIPGGGVTPSPREEGALTPADESALDESGKRDVARELVGGEAAQMVGIRRIAPAVVHGGRHSHSSA